MKYIVYLTINLKSSVNGTNKIYVGVHRTKTPTVFDGYLGCGVWENQPSTYMYPKTPFQCAVKKYGTSSFIRSTLYIFDTKEEAYKKELEIVNEDFIKQTHVYNACLGGVGESNFKALYQFDLRGNLIKKWDYSSEAYEFYNIPMQRVQYAISNYHQLLGYLWSHNSTIDITLYTGTKHGSPTVIYLYSKHGKWLREEYSQKAMAEYLGIDEATVNNALKRQCLIQQEFYVSYSMTDCFQPKSRAQYQDLLFYVYKEDGTYLGEFKGKGVMPIINLHSWNRIRDIMKDSNGWYKNFYLATNKLTTMPQRSYRSVSVDIYTKYGEYIETLNTVKEVREKYNVPSSKIKNIQLGDRYYKDFVFKYHSA